MNEKSDVTLDQVTTLARRLPPVEKIVISTIRLAEIVYLLRREGPTPPLVQEFDC
jgi:hypothetical protein